MGSTEPDPDGNREAVLRRTTDGGRSWTIVHHGPVQSSWTDVGFTSPQQGVAVNDGEAGRLLMTYDGGQTWSPVAGP